MKHMYDSEHHVKDTFNEENLSEYLIQAQWAEFIELKKILVEISLKVKRPLKILDIGIGDGRILKHLHGIDELRDIIKLYHGIDVAKNCVNISSKLIHDMKIDYAKVMLMDALELETLNKQYDLVISTWFTVGNFFPDDFNPNKFSHDLDVSTNPKFTKIFSDAHKLLSTDGEIVIGSLYMDCDSTRKKQEDSFRNFGWTVITDERDSFCATKDGWWSQRFTKEQLCNYLSFLDKSKIEFIPLDTYGYASAVRIKK